MFKTMLTLIFSARPNIIWIDSLRYRDKLNRINCGFLVNFGRKKLQFGFIWASQIIKSPK